MKKHILFSLLIGLVGLSKASAQSNIGIKTNLLYGAYTYTPNLGIEIGLGNHTTLDISGGYNPWNLSSKGGMKKLVHSLVQPEFRYFFNHRFKGHFIGIHGLYSQYNIGGHELPLLFGKGSQAFRHEGFAYGGGIRYGYQLLLGRSWNLEFSVGAGALQMDYGKYDCVNCGQKLSTEKKTYYGPTKAAISIVYLIGRKLSATRPVNTNTNPVVQSMEKRDTTSIRQPFLVSDALSATATEPQSTPVVLVSPPAVPVAAPKPRISTADSLVNHYPFAAPANELVRTHKTSHYELFSPDMPLYMGKGRSVQQQNSVEQFIEDNEQGAIFVNFSRASSLIDWCYKDNSMVLNALTAVLEKIQASADCHVERIIVAGFASPEGMLATNDRLAWERGKAIRDFICANSSVSPHSVRIYNGSEDWRGLRKLVVESDMEARDEILRIIDTVPILSGREGQLMRLAGGRPYRYMAKYFFPKLRNAAYIKVYYTNTGNQHSINN